MQIQEGVSVMTEEAALVPSFHAVAVNATEMQEANGKIKDWLRSKCAAIEAEREEVQAALDSAVTHKWNTKTFRSMIQRIGQKQLYYGKLLTAVEAGFTIVPNMDVSVFAIRVAQERPRWNAYGESEHGQRSASPDIPEVEEKRLPVGQGHYVSPEMETETYTNVKTAPDGKKIHTVQHIARGFEQISFPLAIANPLVMDATANAMALKIFDRIGIVPSGMRKRRGDPIVLGQITRKEGWTTKTASFLIAWYLDVRTL